MSFNLIRRRGFLITLGTFAATMPFRRKGCDAKDGNAAALTFFVAGARFQPAVAGLRAGAPVRVVPGRFNGAQSYAVRASNGLLIGYVPAKVVPLVQGLENRTARLSVADYDAVPWKRFRVTIER